MRKDKTPKGRYHYFDVANMRLRHMDCKFATRHRKAPIMALCAAHYRPESNPPQELLLATPAHWSIRKLLRWAFWPALASWWILHFADVPFWLQLGGLALVALCAIPYWQDEVRHLLRRTKK